MNAVPSTFISKAIEELSANYTHEPREKISVLCQHCLCELNASIVEYQGIIKINDNLSTRAKNSRNNILSETEIKVYCRICNAGTQSEPIVLQDLKKTHPDPGLIPLINAGINNYLGYPVWLNGQITGILNVFTDDSSHDFREMISMVKTVAFFIQAEEERFFLKNENENLQRKAKETEQFISLIAHDLKSPFNGLLGLAYLLSEELENMSGEDIKEVTSSLKKSADNMIALLDNLLEYSRIRRNALKFEPKNQDLNLVLDQTTGFFSDKIKKKNIGILRETQEYCTFHADPHMTTVIFRNVMSNCIKYSKNGDRILVKAVIDKNHYLVVSFEDHGTGIQDEIFHRLFKINELVKKQGTEGEPGSGLGLIICRDFIEKHGGTLKIETKPGEGTLVQFTLPT